MMTKKQISTIRPGQWIRVFFDDVGVRDVLAIDSGKVAVKDGVGLKMNYLAVLDIENGQETIDFDQIIAISNIRIQPPRY